MRKALAFTLAFACLFLAASCDTQPADEAKNDPTATVAETSITATLDTATGSAIPAEFTANVSWKIKDADWKADDAYAAQAYFAGTDGTPIAIGSPFAFEKTQTGTGKYAFKIPDDGLSPAVKKPYELTISVKKGDAQVWKSDAWTFTEGKISGIYEDTLYYYEDGIQDDTHAHSYDYRATLTQYGSLIIATDIFYLYDSDYDDINDKASKQTCTVVMTASTENGKTKLTGTGTYTDKEGTKSYTGEAEVFGDGRTISCDSFWASGDTATKLKLGNFDAYLKGTASISGKVTIENPGNLTSAQILFDNKSKYDCVVAVLYTLNEDNLEDCAGRMVMGPVTIEGTVEPFAYSFTYTLSYLPAGSYYLYFGGTDPDSKTHMPWSAGEAVGLLGLEPADAVKFIDQDASVKVKTDTLVPITVKAGDQITGKDFNAIVRASDKAP